jgi:hypothetical protein
MEANVILRYEAMTANKYREERKIQVWGFMPTTCGEFNDCLLVLQGQ